MYDMNEIFRNLNDVYAYMVYVYDAEEDEEIKQNLEQWCDSIQDAMAYMRILNDSKEAYDSLLRNFVSLGRNAVEQYESISNISHIK